MASCDKVFVLGDFLYRLKSADESLIEELEQILTPLKRTLSSDDEVEVLDLDNVSGLLSNWGSYKPDGDRGELVNLINQRALEHHYGYLWLDAAAVIAQTGKSILICGVSHSGKSTSSLALVVGHGVRLAAEDLVLIDTVRDEIVTFASAFSVRPGTVEKIRNATGIEVGPLRLGEWMPCHEFVAPPRYPAKFDVAFLLLPVEPEVDERLVVTPLSVSEYIKKSLPITNALRIDAGIDKLNEYLRNAVCFELAGGSLGDRIDAMLAML